MKDRIIFISIITKDEKEYIGTEFKIILNQKVKWW